MGPRVLGVEHQADGDGGHVLRQVLACQRTWLRGAQCPSTAYDMKRESLPFRPSGLGFPSQRSGGPDVHTRAKIPPLRRPRANRPTSKLLRRTLLGRSYGTVSVVARHHDRSRYGRRRFRRVSAYRTAAASGVFAETLGSCVRHLVTDHLKTGADRRWLISLFFPNHRTTIGANSVSSSAAGKNQTAFPRQTTTARQLARIETVSPCNTRHRSTGFHRLGHHPRLQLIRPAAPTEILS